MKLSSRELLILNVELKDRADIKARFIVRTSTFDEVFPKEIWGQAYYFQHGATIKPGDVVLDVGGHIGIFSVLAGKMGAFVVTVEPVREHQDLLMVNGKINDIHVEIIPMALGDSDKLVGISQPVVEKGMENTGNIKTINNPALNTETVECKSVHKLMETLPRIDFMKLDCEGSEYEILYAMTDDEYSKVGTISMEWHGELDKAKQLEIYLQGKGYQTFLDWSYGRQGRLIAIKNATSNNKIN